jgi:hypothetical protein
MYSDPSSKICISLAYALPFPPDPSARDPTIDSSTEISGSTISGIDVGAAGLFETPPSSLPDAGGGGYLPDLPT